MRNRLSRECWAAIAVELIRSYYLGEEPRSYREIAELVKSRGYCSTKPSISTISYIRRAIEELPLTLKKVRVRAQSEEEEAQSATDLMEHQRHYIIKLITLAYIIKNLYSSLIKGRSEEPLPQLIRRYIEESKSVKYLHELLLELLHALLDLLKERGDLYIYPEGYTGYYSTEVPAGSSGKLKVRVTARIDLTYVRNDSEVVTDYVQAIEKTIEDCEDPGSSVSDVAKVAKIVRSRCLESILHVYGNLLVNLEEYYRKFMFTKVLSDKLVEVITNHECLKEDPREVHTCLRRHRISIKNEALKQALCDRIVRVKKHEVKDVKVTVRVTPREDRNEVKVSIRMVVPIKLVKYLPSP